MIAFKNILFLIPIFLLLITSACGGNFGENSYEQQSAKPSLEEMQKKGMEKLAKKGAPSDQAFLQRSYPDFTFDANAYIRQIERIKLNDGQKFKNLPAGFSDQWKQEGPSNINGRLNTIAVHPTNKNIIYIGSASGGIFKTTDGGTSWNPIFDMHNYLAIAHIVFHPNNPDILFVGTGDPNISGYPFIGNGIYKSTDAGETWQHLGLSEQAIVSKIAINPVNPDIIFAATMGKPFERNYQRGLYRSDDGGTTWQQVLSLGNSAGIIDLLINPLQPYIIYAAGWNRIRNNTESLLTGPESGIYKSTDGGNNWTKLSNGLPSVNTSRVGIAMSGLNHEKLFAVVIGEDLELEGVYKTTNGGDNWTKTPTTGLPQKVMGGFGWYFGKIAVNPANDDDIYLLGVDLWRTINGGIYWEMAAPAWYNYTVHADKHVLIIEPDALYLGTDGGIYKKLTNANNWTHLKNYVNTQFYRVTNNPHSAGVYAGGAQDNGTLAPTVSGNPNWTRLFGGDGFKVVYHPTNRDLMYVETQNGYIHVLDFGSWYTCYAPPTEERRNWDMPYIMSYHNSDVMYLGTYRIHQNTFGETCIWHPISTDLTRGDILGANFHTISCLAESPLSANYLYAGTSDGKVWSSTDKASTWNDVSSSLPNRYVTSVKASWKNAQTVFVSHSGYKDNDNTPRVHKSTDNGQNWVSIAGDLPSIAVNNLLVSTVSDDIIFAATDAGIYATINGGANWHRLGNKMPYIPVFEMDYDPANNRLIAGTFARGIYSYPLDSIFQLPVSVFPVANKVLAPKVFPNPVVSRINVSIPEKVQTPVMVTVYKLTGQLMEKKEIDMGEEISLDMGSLPGGVYLLQLEYNSKKHLHRILKSH